MKRIILLLNFVCVCLSAYAQHELKLYTPWNRQQVHVVFGGYLVSFSVRDIDKALELLAATGDSTFGSTSHLDTAGNYRVELQPGLRMEYHFPLQPLIQLGVGAFLLSAGHASVVDPEHRKLTSLTINIEPPIPGEDVTTVRYYDPATQSIVFEGKMPVALFGQDLGID